MKREDIEKLLGDKFDDASKKTVIDQIMSINGDDINREKGKSAEFETKIATLEEAAKTANAQIEAFKGMNPEEIKKQADEYKAKYDESVKEGEAKVAAVKKSYEIDLALTKAGARNARAVRALIDENAITFDKEGKVIGMEEQLNNLKTKEAYLFGDNQPAVPPKAGKSPDPSTGKTEEEIMADLRKL